METEIFVFTSHKHLSDGKLRKRKHVMRFSMKPFLKEQISEGKEKPNFDILFKYLGEICKHMS